MKKTSKQAIKNKKESQDPMILKLVKKLELMMQALLAQIALGKNQKHP